MKKVYLFLLPLLFLLPSLHAQTNPCGGSIPHCNVIVVIPATQPTGVVVAKWNLYKSANSGVYGTVPFATNPDPTVLQFMDTTVTQKQVNFYVLTAVDKNGNESKKSNELTATTPSDTPNPPSISVQSF